MADREKLIELCDTNNGWVDEVPAEKFADYLLSHGVTFEKQGEWEQISDESWQCSLCKMENCYAYDFNLMRFTDNYCPNCGARMKGAVNNE